MKPTLRDVTSRTEDGEHIYQKVLFDHDNWIWEQDYATPHSSRVNETWLSENTPNHTPTLRSLKYTKFWMPSKLDDFWYIERYWEILCGDVYSHPEPTNIKALMRRLRKAHRNTKLTILVKLYHELPAHCQEIYNQKGGNIPKSWDYQKSPYRCRCNICSN